MAGIKLFIIFILALMTDGLILPALFNFKNSSLALLAILLPILYMGPEKRTILWGLFFSITSESFRGLNLGTLAIPFLFTVVVICLAQRSLDIKYTYNDRFSLGRSVIVAFVSVAFVYIFSFFYGWGKVGTGFLSPVISLTIMLESLVLIFVFNIVFNNKNDYV